MFTPLTLFYLFLVLVPGGLLALTFVVGEIIDLGGHVGDALAPIGDLLTISAFAVGFGAGGLIGRGLGMPDLVTLFPATGVGILAGGVIWLVARFVYASVGSTSTQATDYVGLICRVSISIPQEGTGAVTLTVKGQRKSIPAISEDGSAISARTRVSVRSMEGGRAIVEKL